ncbi:hypothetical protein CY35_03G118700 [Sphagnum magellanicum]|nr:hypothetical protein CY35_03G118700 [Sphagnum magellanicum]
MTGVEDVSSPHKFLQENVKVVQENAKDLYKQMTPLLQKCLLVKRTGMPPSSASMENRRAGQQADNLVWQQEAFHKILKLQGLLKEGLICKAELQLCRKEILQVVAAVHPDGEWANFTRDKLLFLQDLLREGCISEAEYHATKQPILSRLAEQGAELDSQDFVMLVSPPPPSGTVGHDAPDCRASLITALEAVATASQKSSNTNTEEYSPIKKMGPPDSTTTRKTPIKQVLEAMSRIKNNKANWGADTGPLREAPIPPVGRWILRKESLKEVVGKVVYAHVPVIDQDDDEEAMYAASPVKKLSASPSLGHRRMGDMLSGLVRKLQGESVLPNEAYSPLNTEEESPQLDEDGKIPQTSVLDTRVLREGSNGQGPDTVKLKKKVDTRGPPTNFFIDKVLGDNIKAELTRIRAEMSESSPGQTFTNEQIEAIATRLPVDKVELQRFFPKSWCDRYGDVVLEVVHKEFKDHVGEMENQRKAGKLKRAASKAAKEKELAAFTKNENDENSGHPNISNVLLQSPKTGAAFVKRSPKTSLNQCFTTTGATLVESKAKLPLIEEQPEGDVVRNCRGLGFDKELDGKLTAEILRMPSKRFNDVSGLR